MTFTINTPNWLFGATGGATGGRTGPAGRTGSALELPTAGKGESRHHPIDFFTFALGASDLFRGIEN